MQQTIHIRVSGKVQGVFYRQSAREKARELGLTGFVQNLENGDVEIVATGSPAQLDQLLAWCRQGPPRARVDEVKAENIPFRSFEKFGIER